MSRRSRRTQLSNIETCIMQMREFLTEQEVTLANYWLNREMSWANITECFDLAEAVGEEWRKLQHLITTQDAMIAKKKKRAPRSDGPST